VKKTWIIAAAMLVLSGAVYLSSRLLAQPNTQPRAPQTRIAVCNLSSVIKGYKKYQNFQAEIQADVKKYQENDKKIRDNIDRCVKAIQDTATPADKKAEYEKWLQAYKHQLEDNTAEGKAVLGKKSDEQMVILYKEVREVAQRYAASQAIELVLHYNDADEKADPAVFNSPANVARKMQAGACMPLYITPGMDITETLINMLNGAAGTTH
jgi:Skp family chaperone for outer membrane proteins